MSATAKQLDSILSADRGARIDPAELIDLETMLAGDSAASRELGRAVTLLAPSDNALCIQGEYGSGRAVIARAVHDRSLRSRQPFVSVNAAAFSSQYLEEHLFGGPKPLTGREDCTLFIDSVSDLGVVAQAQLLRLAEANVLDLAGAEVPLHVRVIVADDGAKLRASIGAGRLRTELYYQLRSHLLDLPPLRERPRDLAGIVDRMLAHLARTGAALVISREARAALEGYPFPGNFRELAQALTHAAFLAENGSIDVDHLPLDIQRHHRSRAVPVVFDPDKIESLDAVAKRFERDYLMRVLRAVAGNRTRAAKMLDLSRKGLWQKLKAHGIEADEGRAGRGDD